jgi:hypothetical protein
MSDDSKSIEELFSKTACLVLYFLKSFNFKVSYMYVLKNEINKINEI